MQSSQANGSAGKRRVVDALTRTLHGLMALSFVLAYISSELDSFRFVHVTMGYTMGFVVLLRLAWGLAGPRSVHLGALFQRWPRSSQWLESVRKYEWKVMLKHLLSLSLTILLIIAVPVLVSGYVTYFSLLGRWVEELHETVANVMLLAVICHIGSVGALALLFPEAQLRPMLSGQVSGTGPHLVKKNRTMASFTLLVMVASFWVWQSYQFAVDPQYLVQPNWLHPVGGYKSEDD